MIKVLLNKRLCVYGVVLLGAGLGLGGCCHKPRQEPTPKYQGADFKYHSKGTDGYGAPNGGK